MEEHLTGVITRALDLRSEFEAQLRAVTRLEQLLKQLAEENRVEQASAAALLRELGEMLKNNRSIHEILLELAAAVTPPPEVG